MADLTIFHNETDFSPLTSFINEFNPGNPSKFEDICDEETAMEFALQVSVALQRSNLRGLMGSSFSLWEREISDLVCEEFRHCHDVMFFILYHLHMTSKLNCVDDIFERCLPLMEEIPDEIFITLYKDTKFSFLCRLYDNTEWRMQLYEADERLMCNEDFLESLFDSLDKYADSVTNELIGFLSAVPSNGLRKVIKKRTMGLH